MAIGWIFFLEIDIGPPVFGEVVDLQKKVDPGLLQPFNDWSNCRFLARVGLWTCRTSHPPGHLITTAP
jgi:hypothetical protein